MTKEEREKAIRKLTEIKNNYERSLNLNTDFSKDDSEDELYALELAIRALEQEPKWTPVSKELPKCNGVYEVTMRCEDGLYVSACYFDGQDTWHNDNRINFGRPFANDKVIAWMPLPELYEAESEE